MNNKPTYEELEQLDNREGLLSYRNRFPVI